MRERTLELSRPNRSVSRAEFQQAYRHVPLPVAIVLVRDLNGVIRGITCTSATSLSASPPMAMFSVDDKTSFVHCVENSGQFSINYLAADRADWARAFSRGGASLDALVPVIGLGRNLAPALSSGTTAVLECQLADVARGGDHWIVTGTITYCRRQSDAPALLYRAGSYGSFADIAYRTKPAQGGDPIAHL